MSSIPTNTFEVCNVYSEVDRASGELSDLQYTIQGIRDELPESPFTEELDEKLGEAIDYVSQAEDQLGYCDTEINAELMLLEVGDVVHNENHVLIVTEVPEEDIANADADNLSDWSGDMPVYVFKDVKTKEEAHVPVDDTRFRYKHSYLSKSVIEEYAEIYQVLNSVMVYEREQLEVATNPTGPDRDAVDAEEKVA